MRTLCSNKVWPFLLGTAFLLLGTHYGLAWYFPAVALISLGAWHQLEDPEPKTAWLAIGPCLLFCWLALPELSDDYHRYLWEGFVQNQGHSPYREAPIALAEQLDHPSEGKVNHPEYTAIYPPLAQYCFRLAALIGPTVMPWKLLILLVLGLPLWVPSYRARFGWQLATPLLLVEGLWHAHLDILGVALGSGLILAMERRRPALAGTLLAAMVGIKLLPLLFLPACLSHLDRRGRWRFMLAMTMVLALVFAPYVADGLQLFASFRAFAGQWAFNNPLFLGLKVALGASPARLALALCLLLAVGWILVQRRSLGWHCTALWLSLSLFSPTVYPWYLLWLLAFVPRERARWLVLLYAAAFLSYWVLFDFRSQGIWQESAYWMVPEWALMLYAGWRLLDVPAEVSASPNSDL